jgi:pyruvate ferredoxin oxidoreductase gamma subunit/2-oxoisovalerate ferredoxin oxidoreductase gamma subunit
MFEIRFHGRGGQGAVMAAEITALAAFLDGKYPQSFPSFGLERRGAPVAAFLRVDNEKITIRQGIYHPDFVVVMDPTLLEIGTTLAGLKPGGGILVNTTLPPGAVDAPSGLAIGTVAARDIALEHNLGNRLLPIINTTIIGALVRMTGVVSMESLLDAIGQSIGPKRAEANQSAARRAHGSVVVETRNER